MSPHSPARVLLAKDCPAMPWRNGGGQTRELLTWPAGSAPDQWQLRISRADIDYDGPFSAFPGVQRWFAVLKGQAWPCALVAPSSACVQVMRL